MDDCLLASERVNECASRCSRGAAPRADGLGPARAARLPAQPRRSARAAAPASCRSGSSRRPGKLDTDALIDAVDVRRPVLDAAGAARRDHHRRRDRAPLRRAAAARAARRPRVPDLAPRRSSRPTRRWPSSSTRVAAEYARCAATSASSTCTAASARSGCRSPPARARSSASRSSSRRWPTRSRTRASTTSSTRASTPATSASRCATWSSRPAGPDVAVVDPPRAGLSQKVVRRIIEAAPSRIVYVSCNPTTLAPNAAQIVEAGYRLVKVRPVDMFPQTPHIECVALLERDVDCLLGRQRGDAGVGFVAIVGPRRVAATKPSLWRGFRHTRRARIDACDEPADRGSVPSRRSPRADACDEPLAIGRPRRRTAARAASSATKSVAVLRIVARTRGRDRRVRRSAHQSARNVAAARPARTRATECTQPRRAAPTAQQLTFADGDLGGAGQRLVPQPGERGGDGARRPSGSTAIPQCEARISTNSSAAGSRHARQSTMPSVRE